jgi:cysteine desulfurase
MLANNETGVVQPAAEVARLAREAGVPVHVDAVQAAGRMPVDVRDLGADFVSISAHKIGGPVGIGALYVREGAPLRPLMMGGGQERRRRPGTEPVALAAGFAAAAREAATLSARDTMQALRDRLEQIVTSSCPGARVNGAEAPRLPNTSSLTFTGVDNEALVIRMDLAGFAISTGSACSTGASRPSHVLEAMGLSAADAKSTVRVSLGPDTTQEGIDAFAAALVAEVARRPDRRAVSGPRHSP